MVLVPLLAGACSSSGATPERASGPVEPEAGLSTVALERPPACIASPAVALDRRACARKDAPDALDGALARVGLDRCSFGLSSDALALSKLDAHDPRMLASARDGLTAPLALPAYGVATAAALDEALASPTPVTRAIVAAASLRDAPIAACADAAWYAPVDAEAPLAGALAEVRHALIAPDEVAGVPRELQRALVPIVRALAAANVTIMAARRDLSPALIGAVAAVPSWLLGVRHFTFSSDAAAAFETVDATAITRAAASVALVVESANLGRWKGAAFENRSLPTPFGPLVINGATDDTWSSADDDAPALLLDTGGDDTYLTPVASATRTRSVSVAIDLGGRDTYTYREVKVPADALGARLPSDGAGRAPDGRTFSRVGRQGSGVLGAGLLFDLGDDPDTYRSLIASQGAGSHGVGVLYDAGGNDTYEAEGFSQGAAAWGIGLLLDREGDDRHTLYQAGQGYGFTRGVGALVDGAGDDRYVANSGEPTFGGDRLYGSDQLPGPPVSTITGNHSFAQGCGAGHRPDWPDPGFPFPGGLGVLRDATGKDRYVAGVFAQGVGFVQGIGMLLEGSGDDRYDALYYAQGAAVHQGIALLVDRDGADSYDQDAPNQGASIGLANDLSVSVVFDANGDDRFRSPVLSLGAALANGLALFASDGGDDLFRTSSTCGFGCASGGDVTGMRATLPTIGVFVKARGRGTYLVSDSPDARANHAWGDDDPKKKSAPARSAGIDQPGGHVHLALQ